MTAPQFDLVVIGGGVIGVSAATFAAESHATVLLVERAGIGAEASGRNSGVLQHPTDPVLARLHLETMNLYRRLAEFQDASRTTFRMAGSPAGMLFVSRDRAVTQRLSTKLGHTYPYLDATYLDEIELSRLEPSMGPNLTACRVSMGYPVEPLATTTAYEAAARRLGVQIVTGQAAELWLEGDVALGVRVDGRKFASQAVVVACGHWSPALLDPSGTWRPIAPVWGVVVDVELEMPPLHVLEEANIDWDIEPQKPDAPANSSDVVFSLVTLANRSALGSTFLPKSEDPAARRDGLLAHGSEFVPGLKSAVVRASRICARPVSGDGRPIIGAVPWLHRAYIAAGHGAWGLSIGPATGRMVADLALGRRAGIPAELDPGRFVRPKADGGLAHFDHNPSVR